MSIVYLVFHTILMMYFRNIFGVLIAEKGFILGCVEVDQYFRRSISYAVFTRTAMFL